MGFEDKLKRTLERFDDYVKENNSLDWVLSAFYPSFKYGIEPYRHAGREGNAERLNATQKHLKDYYEKLREKDVPEEDLVKEFKTLLQDTDLRIVFSKYSQYMDERLLHSERIGLIFNNTAGYAPENDIMDLVDAITQSTIMNQAAQIDESALTNVKNLCSQAFLEIAEKCPVEQKEECFYKLDTNPYFQASMHADTGRYIVAHTFASLLESNSTEDALRMLKNSETWPSIPKTSSLGQSLLSADKRLMPAMNFEAYQHTPQHNL